MILGSYAFEWLPDRWTIPDAERVIGEVKTYNSSVVFDFGVSLSGKQIVMEWDWMPAAQFDAMDLIFQADEPISWVLEKGVVGSILVDLISLTGDLFEVIGYDEAFPYREKVKATLLILGGQALS